MSSDSFFTSANSEKRGFPETANNFPKEHIVVAIDLDTPFCVFKVPKTLTGTKPEAYTPQKMGLGPYHHLQPHLYTMQKQKLSAVGKFMNQENPNNIRYVVGALMQCEPVLRACYDQYLDLDANMLAWIVAVDGLYLLQFLRKYYRKNETTHDEFSAEPRFVPYNPGKSCLEDPEIERDIVMLENQIPVVLLKEILRVLRNDIHTLFEGFDVFCRKHSPLELSKNRGILQDKNQDHLLHRMYHLIVNNGVTVDYYPLVGIVTNGIHDDHPPQADHVNVCPVNMATHPLGIAMNIVLFLHKVPWDKIKALFKKHDADEQNQLVEEGNIPSVTQMSEIAGITFVPAYRGIRYIHFNKYRRKFYLPVIAIDVHTETILRNLVAFELSKPGSTHELASYVDFMCAIIDTKKDVEILKNANIIKGELPDDEIVRIFKGIWRSTEKNDKETSNINQAIDDVKEKYNDLWSVKVKRSLKKCFCVSWKYMRVVFSVVVVVVLTLQAFCSVFGCTRWFGRRGALNRGHFLFAE
ncbi:hypothetical protein CDL12_25552 [Handroanthus impetiginosus]|uniref:Uncharacterized protein n=1 Tax=Handroanthus impetiginosus TaxID=429701 RepID=A0A2G9G9F7_9LAMI|nr:hypothetical protein CDL12_25552 [Handroanthus impetiginosus]